MCRIAPFAVSLLLVFASYSAGQVTRASVTGRITDPNQAAVSAAKITLVNLDTNLSHEAEANDSGMYYVTQMTPGRYRMEVVKSGFRTVQKPEITLHVQEVLEINVEMTIGSVSESVSVVGSAPSVDLTTSSVSAVVNGTTVRELPLNGRSWTDLATLEPGVNVIASQPQFAGDSNSRGNRGFGAQISIRGARPTENNYRLDGISLNDFANAGPGNVLGGNLGVDAIQEFSVLTANFSAEYGKTSGGVVNAITRSGTNQFHGSAYEFLRNSALDARNFFDPATKPTFRRNQFGGALGGPIIKDRTFFFADYEGVRQFKGVSTTALVPSVAARAGNLCSAPSTPGACTPSTVVVDPSAAKYLTFFPVPNNGLAAAGNGDTGFYTFTSNQVLSEDFFTTRIDHRFSSRDNLFGTYMYDRNPYRTPDGLNQLVNGHLVGRNVLVLEETRVVTPNLINAVRLGFNRVATDNLVSVEPINPATADPALAMFPGSFAGQVSISGGFTAFIGGIDTGGGRRFRWNSYQFYDDASYTRGGHSFKFGGAFERMQQNQIAYDVPGRYTFNNLRNYLTNVPNQFQANLGFGTRGFRQSIFGAYFQDDWRVRRNLTVNVGIRYEMATIMTEVNGKLSNLRGFRDAAPAVGSPFTSNPTKLNFEPRIGFAWDPFGSGKTSVRGAFGLYDVLPLIYQYFVNENTLYPYGFRTVVSAPAGSFFQRAPALVTPNSFTVLNIEPNPPRTYVLQWNLNIQREISPTLTGTIGYVGSRGVHQPFKSNEVDAAIPVLTEAGYLYPSPRGSGTKINPNFGNVQAILYQGNSYYHGMVAGLTKRMGAGLQFKTSYTWNKSIDTGSASAVGNFFDNSIAALPWFDMRLNRGLSDFNVGRNLVVNAIWRVPSRKSSGLVSKLSNGWQLGAIFSASDGQPFTATYGTGGDPEGNKGTNSFGMPNRLVGSGCETLTNPGNPDKYVKTECFGLPSAPTMAFWNANCDTTSNIYGSARVRSPYPVCFNLRGNAGRNILIGPGLQNLDFSLVKDSRIRENFTIQFRAELFNILNHANFVAPATANGQADIFDANGVPTSAIGKLLSTSTTARQAQFAVKFVW